MEQAGRQVGPQKATTYLPLPSETTPRPSQIPKDRTASGLLFRNTIKCQLWPRYLATRCDSAGFLCKTTRSTWNRRTPENMQHPELQGNASVSRYKCTEKERASCAFSEVRLCTAEWSWPITHDITAAQLLFSGARRPSRVRLRRHDLLFLSVGLTEAARRPHSGRRAAQQASQPEFRPGSES